MRLEGQDIEKQIIEGAYNSHLKGLSYDHSTFTVEMKFGDYNNITADCTVIFKECSSVQFKTWDPNELDFFFHDVEVEDVEIKGKKLYICSLVIPMMDCQITCGTVELTKI